MIFTKKLTLIYLDALFRFLLGRFVVVALPRHFQLNFSTVRFSRL